MWWEQEYDKLGEAPATSSGHTPASTQHSQPPSKSSPGGSDARQVTSLNLRQDEIPGSKLSKNQPIFTQLDSKPQLQPRSPARLQLHCSQAASTFSDWKDHLFPHQTALCLD